QDADFGIFLPKFCLYSVIMGVKKLAKWGVWVMTIIPKIRVILGVFPSIYTIGITHGLKSGVEMLLRLYSTRV
ncbi:hypothetical protein, partial [Psychrobacter celer]|uniref:hypothetical protein n=1 Tax=Psychrobacter celer TaxID=306572 RepID=UPI001D11B580